MGIDMKKMRDKMSALENRGGKNIFLRPTEVDELVGDFQKARKILGWSPKVSLEEMIEKMVKNDIKLLGENNG